MAIEEKGEVLSTDRDLAFSWLYFNTTRLISKREKAKSEGNRKKANKINMRIGNFTQDLEQVKLGDSNLIDQFANFERARRAELMNQTNSPQ